MKKTTETVYSCEHCGKKMFSAGAMSLHERMCRRNPNNMHRCFAICKHCTKEYQDTKDNDYEFGNRRDIVFLCAKQPQLKMYSYKLERYLHNSPRMQGLTRMPLECDLFEVDEAKLDM